MSKPCTECRAYPSDPTLCSITGFFLGVAITVIVLNLIGEVWL